MKWMRGALAMNIIAIGACEAVVPTDEPLIGDEVSRPQPEGVAVCDPGNKRLHRLNRTEYDNTTRDLLGVDARLGQGFPADDVGYGFDNVADVLSTSPLLVEKLDAAAETLAGLALAGGSSGVLETFEAEVLGSTVGSAGATEWNLFGNGEIVANVTIENAGIYTLRARARESAAGDERAHMVFSLDGVEVAGFDVTTTPTTYEHQLEISAGAHAFSVAFTNDFYLPAENADRNLRVDYLEIEGGASAGSSGPRDRIMVCDSTGGSASCARAIFEAFLPRAYRRPASAEEVEGLVAIVAAAESEGESFDGAVKHALHAVLLSPSFLFRVELDSDPESAEPHWLAPHELASRLSYFLWSSMPDDALLAKAADGSLADIEVMLAEVDRMLADDKSRALTQALSGQWLQSRSLDDARPDPARFPEVNDALKASMREESARFVDRFLRSDDRPLADMVDADFTFADAALAAWYGLPFDGENVDERGFAEVSLAGSARGGLLTQGAFLTFTSYPLRTSPVKRGKWVLEQLLCMPPEDPPANVVGEFNEDESAGTVRERLEVHRTNPECAACHVMMDPIGFGLERFDAAGRFRATDNGEEIDDSDVFFTGQQFHGSRELGALIKEMPELNTCVSSHVATYGVGRGIEQEVEADRCTIRDVSGRAVAEGGSLGDIVRAVVTSDAFQKRRGEER